jgi:hypothetical protein
MLPNACKYALVLVVISLRYGASGKIIDKAITML